MKKRIFEKALDLVKGGRRPAMYKGAEYIFLTNTFRPVSAIPVDIDGLTLKQLYRLLINGLCARSISNK